MSKINTNLCYIPANKNTQTKKNEENSKKCTIDIPSIGVFGGGALAIGGKIYSCVTVFKNVNTAKELHKTIAMVSKSKNASELKTIQDKLKALHKKERLTLNKSLTGELAMLLGLGLTIVSAIIQRKSGD